MFLRWDSYYVKFVSSKIYFFVPIKCNLFWFITLQPDNELCYIRNFYPLERATFGKESKQIKLLTAATFFIETMNLGQVLNCGIYNFNLQGKGCLSYKTITSHNFSSETQVNFFIL